MVRGTPRGYFTDPTKRILIVSSQNVPRAEAFFWGYSLQIVTRSRYHGGFVGSKSSQDYWLGEKVEGWRDSVFTLTGVARQHLQTAYAGL